ncbi:MAG: flippase-like domain-containing protein [Alphaproteobacteria bacterium]|nr:flippase-like domain-containing protein [Alphaproteobacteria bacterium]
MSAPTARRRLVLAAQILASVLVVALLLKDAQVDEVRAALTKADLRWVALAALAKAGGLTLHEIRLWASLLPFRRLPVLRVITIGYVSGLTNTLLPVRGGDLIAAALLRQELGVRGPAALAAVAITGFLEAAVFGVFVLAVVMVGAARWEELLGAAATARAQGTMTLLTVGAVFGSVFLVLLSRRLRGGGAPQGPGPIAILRETIVSTGEGLSSWGPLGLNLLLSALQVALVVLSFWAILPALGLEPPVSLLAVSGVIALGSLAAVVLPPSLGAGPAASAIVVLGFFGISEAEALGFAALSWVANTLPALVLGLGPLLNRVGRLPALIRGGPEEPGAGI